MTISARAALMAGVATVTASAVLVAPSVQPLPPPKPTIQLAADSSALQPSDPISDYIAQLNAYFPQLIDAAGQQLSDPATFLSDWAERILTPPSFGTAPPPPPPVVIPTPGSIASSLERGYHAIEPWVQWGFELAAYGVGFIPWFGWLAPQITIFYHFGEDIVHAIAHNTLDWLDGDGTFWQNVGDGVNETINAFINLANAQIDFWLPSLPPLPPLPCIFRCNLAATTLMGPTTTPLGEFAPAGELLDRVTAPVRNGIGFGAGLLRDAFDRVPLVSDIAGQSIPGAVEATEDVGETARAERIKTRGNQAAQLAKTPETVAKGVVQAQGEVRGAVAKAATDVTNAVRAGRPGKITEEVAKGPTTVATGLRDTATKAVNDVRQAAKDAREASKDRTAADDD